MVILSKSAQVERVLRGRVGRAIYPHGSMIPTETDLMKEFGVGRNTIRQAVEVLENDGLLIRRRGSGTYVNFPVDKKEIAILGLSSAVHSGQDYFQAQVLAELSRCIKDAGYRGVHYFGDRAGGEDFINSVKMFDPGVLDNTAGVAAIHHTGMFEERLRKMGIPMAGISLGLPVCRRSVVLDYPELLRQGALAFANHGIKEFAVVHFGVTSGLNEGLEDRELDKQIQALGRRRGVTLVPVEYTPDARHSYETVRKFISGRTRPQGIFFLDDCIFDLASRAFLELGLRAPDDIRILTFTNIGRHFAFPGPVSAIGFSPIRIADELWRMLERLIRCPDGDYEPVKIEPEFVPGITL